MKTFPLPPLPNQVHFSNNRGKQSLLPSSSLSPTFTDVAVDLISEFSTSRYCCCKHQVTFTAMLQLACSWTVHNTYSMVAVCLDWWTQLDYRDLELTHWDQIVIMTNLFSSTTNFIKIHQKVATDCIQLRYLALLTYCKFWTSHNFFSMTPPVVYEPMPLLLCLFQILFYTAHCFHHSRSDAFTQLRIWFYHAETAVNCITAIPRCLCSMLSN